MPSDGTYREAFVWVWLPGAAEPLVAGKLTPADGRLLFNYGRSYLARDDAIPIYAPELPLRSGLLPLPGGLSMPGCMAVAHVTAWHRKKMPASATPPAAARTRPRPVSRRCATPSRMPTACNGPVAITKPTL